MSCPSNTRAPLIRREEAADQVHERGLAGAVRPDEAQELALPDRQRDVVDRPVVPERLGDVPDLQEAHGRRSPAQPGGQLAGGSHEAGRHGEDEGDEDHSEDQLPVHGGADRPHLEVVVREAADDRAPEGAEAAQHAMNTIRPEKGQ